MLLAIDVGNTHTVAGVYEGERMVRGWRVATEKQQTADELRARMASLFFADRFDEKTIDGVALCSVVPALTKAWVNAMRDMLGIETMVCNAETAGDLFKATYPRPHEVGADRIADAIAARELYGAPVIVLDFGTATNIEVVDKDGFFVGGIIAPGVETSAQALFSRATKLSAIALEAPPQAIGFSTEEAVQSGIVLGEADRVDGLVCRVFAQMGEKATVVATGGLARLIAEHSSEISLVNPDLTLEGLRIIYASRNV